MKNTAVYFEKLSLSSLLIAMLSNIGIRNIFLGFNIYYFDSSVFARKILIPLLVMFNVLVKQLHFRMVDIIDENGESVRIRIPRVDLWDVKDKIKNSEAFKSFSNSTWQQGLFESYLLKGLIDDEITEKDSVSRILYLVLVVNWHAKKHDHGDLILLIGNRPWLEIYKKYANTYNISLFSIPTNRFIVNKKNLKNFLRKYPKIFLIFKNITNINSIKSHSNNLQLNQMMYVDGRGDVNLDNNGNNSDFFWYLNSDFPIEKILYKYISDSEKKYLDNHNLAAVSENLSIFDILKKELIKPITNFDSRYALEFISIKTLANLYCIEQIYWRLFFKTYAVKIYFSWYRFNNNHMAIADAIRGNGGISTIWQVAFQGYNVSSFEANFDVYFCYSKYSYEVDKLSDSKMKYYVITGYLKDYASSFMKESALKLRKKLEQNGAKKIVSVIDENSMDDSRWHSGHGLQRENYSYILEKVLEEKWLGVVFKPKRSIDLRKRLGPVADLLKKAEETGRCYIYEDSGRYTSSATPVLAGLSADICIHGHLCAGTAAMECALEGLPTLLIDREGSPYSKLYDLPEGKVVFKDWPSAIEALMKHFSIPEGISGFGDWTSILDDLDPFRDGMAAYRMGTYLQWLIEGFENNIDREVIMVNAAERYKKQWGEDKVITS